MAASGIPSGVLLTFSSFQDLVVLDQRRDFKLMHDGIGIYLEKHPKETLFDVEAKLRAQQCFTRLIAMAPNHGIDCEVQLRGEKRSWQLFVTTKNPELATEELQERAGDEVTNLERLKDAGFAMRLVGSFKTIRAVDTPYDEDLMFDRIDKYLEQHSDKTLADVETKLRKHQCQTRLIAITQQAAQSGLSLEMNGKPKTWQLLITTSSLVEESLRAFNEPAVEAATNLERLKDTGVPTANSDLEIMMMQVGIRPIAVGRIVHNDELDLSDSSSSSSSDSSEALEEELLEKGALEEFLALFDDKDAKPSVQKQAFKKLNKKDVTAVAEAMRAKSSSRSSDLSSSSSDSTSSSSDDD